MSDAPKNLPTISFGAPATSAGSAFGGLNQTSAPDNKTSSSLFGSVTNPPASGSTLFGSTGNTSGGTQQPSLLSGTAKSGQSSSIFGAGSGLSNPTSTGFSFGPQATASSQQSSGFSFGKPPETGSAEATSITTPFPGFSTPDKASALATSGQTQSTNLFGGLSSTGGSGLFGNAASSTPAPSKTGGAFSFANTSTTPAGPPPSGGNVGSATAGFSFNKPQQQTANPFSNAISMSSSAQEIPSTTAPSSLFGNIPQSASGGAFGSSKPGDTTAATSTAAPLSSLSANANTNSGTGLFNMRAASKPAGGLFGNLGRTQENIAAASTPPATVSTVATSGTLQPSQQAEPSGPAQNSSVFATLGNTRADATATSQATTSADPKPAFSFPSSTPTATTQPSSTPAPTTAGTGTSGLFSNLGTSTADASTATPAATSAGGLFANTAKAAERGANSIGQTPSTTATSGLAGATAPAPSSGLFASLNKPVNSTSTSQAPAATAADSGNTNVNGTSTINPGTSTSGPAPTSQSRLKNKSMDEIITRWASDLSKYQKEFQGQAEKVAKWDRMLVENSDKIQKLYGSTLEAERATSEVERQLSAVESQQEELSGWLDRYERDVDTLMSRQVGKGEGLQGPDQERERTYKLAEKLTERLDEMGKDLTSMIEEINDASSTISKNSKADDPISQIVRVLNSHLSQLQMIDQGAAALQLKVAAAQKAGQGLGSSNGFKGLGSDAADDFYRSYMGRR